jgi:hypothetical protein
MAPAKFEIQPVTNVPFHTFMCSQMKQNRPELHALTNQQLMHMIQGW